MRHGTQHAYQDRGCHCPTCLQGQADRRRAIRRRKRGWPDPPIPECPWCTRRCVNQTGLGVHMAACSLKPASVA